MLTMFLLLFSKTKLQLEYEDIFRFFLILFFLFLMRLYDDIQNAIIDKLKENRIYTEIKAQKKLSVVLGILLIPFLIIFYLYKTELLFYVIGFIVINQILYLILFDLKNFKSYLPLLKYPLVSIALLNGFNWVCLALFVAMVVFELLEDSKFPMEYNYSYPLAILALVLLLPSVLIEYFVLLLFIISITFFIISRKTKWTPYIFLLIFLTTRLIIISYEI